MDEISIDDRERTKKKKQKVIIEEKKRDPDGKKKGKRRIRVRGCHRKISRHDCESRGRRKRIRVLKRRDERSRYERRKAANRGPARFSTVSARRIRADVSTKPLLLPSLRLVVENLKNNLSLLLSLLAI